MIAGAYYDEKGFKYLVEEEGRIGHEEEFIISLINPEGKYCGHAHYKRVEIKSQLEGLTRTNPLESVQA